MELPSVAGHTKTPLARWDLLLSSTWGVNVERTPALYAARREKSCWYLSATMVARGLGDRNEEGG
jgi:hypothetical protein